MNTQAASGSLAWAKHLALFIEQWVHVTATLGAGLPEPLLEWYGRTTVTTTDTLASVRRGVFFVSARGRMNSMSSWTT